MTTRANPESTQLVQELRRSMHELNNALTPILANAQLARLLLEPPSTDIREALDDVVDAAGRANGLVGEMRAIATRLQDLLDGATASEEAPEADRG